MNLCPINLVVALEQYKNILVIVILPMHLYEMPSKMNEIQFIADQYGVPVIEDASEALELIYRKQRYGTLGQAELSFNGYKITTTSNGGALFSKNKDYIDQARFLVTRVRDNAPQYPNTQICYND